MMSSRTVLLIIWLLTSSSCSLLLLDVFLLFHLMPISLALISWPQKSPALPIQHLAQYSGVLQLSLNPSEQLLWHKLLIYESCLHHRTWSKLILLKPYTLYGKLKYFIGHKFKEIFLHSVHTQHIIMV